MSWKKALRALGTIAGTVNPVVGTAIAAVNAFLPENHKLPPEATGDQVISRYDTLGPSEKAHVDKRLDHELGMEKERTSQLQAAWEHDSSGASTRPYIAKQSFHVVAALTFIYVGTAAINQQVLSWEQMAVILSPYVAWAGHYMGLRAKEKIARYNTATGNPALGAIASIVSSFKK